MKIMCNATYLPYMLYSLIEFVITSAAVPHPNALMAAVLQGNASRVDSILSDLSAHVVGHAHARGEAQAQARDAEMSNDDNGESGSGTASGHGESSSGTASGHGIHVFGPGNRFQAEMDDLLPNPKRLRLEVFDSDEFVISKNLDTEAGGTGWGMESGLGPLLYCTAGNCNVLHVCCQLPNDMERGGGGGGGEEKDRVPARSEHDRDSAYKPHYGEFMECLGLKCIFALIPFSLLSLLPLTPSHDCTCVYSQCT